MYLSSFKALLFADVTKALHDRLLVVCAIATILLTACAVIVNGRSYVVAEQQFRRNGDVHLDSLQMNITYRDAATNGVVLDRRPEPLSILVAGQLSTMPPSVSVSLGSGLIDQSDYKLVENQRWQSMTGGFDLAFVITVCLSLFTLMTTYSQLADDRDSGRLILLLAQPSPRILLWFSKLVTGSAVILTPFTLTLMITVATASFMWSQRWPSEAVPALIGIWGVSTAYLLGFAALGLLSATILKRSGVAFAAVLAIWIGSVFVAPAAALIASELIHPIRSVDTVAEIKRGARNARWMAWTAREFAYEKGHGHAAHYDVSNEWMLEREFGSAADLAAIDQQYQAELKQQVDTGVRLGSFSPTIACQMALSAIAGTGLKATTQFLVAVADYQRAFRSTMWRKSKTDPSVPQPTAQLDLTDLPQFRITSTPVLERIASASLQLFSIMTFAVMMTLISCVSFIRVRV